MDSIQSHGCRRRLNRGSCKDVPAYIGNIGRYASTVECPTAPAGNILYIVEIHLHPLIQGLATSPKLHSLIKMLFHKITLALTAAFTALVAAAPRQGDFSSASSYGPHCYKGYASTGDECITE